MSNRTSDLRDRALAGLGGRRRCGRVGDGRGSLTRALPGGFLGDHVDVGNWRCPLGIAALSVESVIILLVLLVVLGAWQARVHAASVAAAAPACRAARARVQPVPMIMPAAARPRYVPARRVAGPPKEH